MLSLVTFISPAIGLVLILWIGFTQVGKAIPSNIKILAMPIALCIAQLGYVQTSSASDLQSYYENLQYYGGSLGSILKNDSQALYLRDLLMYLVHRSGDERLLPYIVGFVIYWIVFYILFDMVDRNRDLLKPRDVICMILIIFGITFPTTAIGNIRFVTASMIISFATYRDLIQKKRGLITLLLYIVPIFLHTEAVFILLIRVMQGVARRIGLWSILVVFFFPSLVYIANNHLSLIPGSILKSAVQRAEFYLSWNEGGFATTLKSDPINLVTRWYGTFFILYVLGLILYSVKKKDRIKIWDQPMVGYVFLVGVFGLACLNITTGAFWRFETIFAVLCPIYLIPIKKLHTRAVGIPIKLLLISILISIANNVRFTYWNYRLSKMAVEYFVGSGITIIVDFFKMIFM